MKFFKLKNKNFLVTGGAGLLGQKHVEAIIIAGGNPVVLDFSQEKIDLLKSYILKKYKKKIITYKVDITVEKNIKQLAKQFSVSKFIINGIINNAALNPTTNNLKKKPTRLENYALKDWRKAIDVELTGSFLIVKHFGFLMAQQGLGGVILNISSDLGLISPDQRLYSLESETFNQKNVKPISYSVTKSAMIGFTRYMATYWVDKNIRCNVICPGGVYTKDMSKKFIDRIVELIPMGRMARVDEYQGTVIWAISEASSYLNGAVIPIDGGRSVW
ncbi:SDR family oxidoreductase [Alphaproteobacteria bacterium]|nr:SDR family oxidoreductase [Alphaproteobacteria bacterium]